MRPVRFAVGIDPFRERLAGVEPDERPPALPDYARAVTAAFPDPQLKLLFEPGRALTGMLSVGEVATRDFLQRLNEKHLERFPGDSELAGVSAFARLQTKVGTTGPGAPHSGDDDNHNN